MIVLKGLGSNSLITQGYGLSLAEALGIVSIGIDSILRISRASSINLDAYLISALLQHDLDVSIDAVFRRVGITLSTSVDAILKKYNLAKITSVDAILKKEGIVLSTSVDAILGKRDLTKITSVDAILREEGITLSTSVDAILRKHDLTKYVTLSAILRKEGIAASINLDAFLIYIKQLSVSVEAVLRKTLQSGVDLDAILGVRQSQLKDLVVDAILFALGHPNKIFDYDAIMELSSGMIDTTFESEAQNLFTKWVSTTFERKRR